MTELPSIDTAFPVFHRFSSQLDFGLVSGLATQDASLAATRQDGSEPGVLNSFVVGEDGTIRGVFSNGVTRDLGQLQLARFANPVGLEARGLNLFAKGINTGLPVQGAPGESGIGSVIGGALELSNTDIGKDLIELVLASTQYRGNSRVITTSQQLARRTSEPASISRRRSRWEAFCSWIHANSDCQASASAVSVQVPRSRNSSVGAGQILLCQHNLQRLCSATARLPEIEESPDGQSSPDRDPANSCR